MNAVETLEAAITKLEELRDEATPTPWESDPDRELYARYRNEQGVMVSQLGSLGSVRRDEDGWMVAVLTRTIGPVLAILRDDYYTCKRNSWTPDLHVLMLARAILGES